MGMVVLSFGFLAYRQGCCLAGGETVVLVAPLTLLAFPLTLVVL
jgi:hypothetical protein